MKQSYGIPYSLDSSYLDMEISIHGDSAVGTRPMPIKNLLLILAGVMSCFFILAKTQMSRGSIFDKVIFVIGWAGLCLLLLTTTKTHLLGLERIVSLAQFMSPGARFTNTRRNANATDLMAIVGLEKVDPENCMIHYNDGSVGFMYDIVGNASVLLFDAHKEAIINHVDAYYRKMPQNVTYHYITIKEPQRIDRQVDAIVKRQQKLTVYDPDLMALMDTNRYVFSDLIGSTFKSIHQYLLIQAKNPEYLEIGAATVIEDMQDSGLMFKSMELLNEESIRRVMTTIYGTRKGI